MEEKLCKTNKNLNDESETNFGLFSDEFKLANSGMFLKCTNKTIEVRTTRNNLLENGALDVLLQYILLEAYVLKLESYLDKIDLEDQLNDSICKCSNEIKEFFSVFLPSPLESLIRELSEFEIKYLYKTPVLINNVERAHQIWKQLYLSYNFDEVLNEVNNKVEIFKTYMDSKIKKQIDFIQFMLGFLTFIATVISIRDFFL